VIPQLATLILMIDVSCMLQDSLMVDADSNRLLAWERYHERGNMPRNL
jgi:hypothetical protein